MILERFIHFSKKLKRDYLNKMNESHNLIINKSDGLTGEIIIPGDKSITHRAIILASLCTGKTKIYNHLSSEDCKNTIEVMKSLGVNILNSQDHLLIEGKGVHSLKKPTKQLYAGNSGTLIRLISGILAMQPFESAITGDESLKKRPMNRVIEPLKSMGGRINSDNGRAPLDIKANNLPKTINHLAKIPSAQIKSCLILASLFSDGKSIIKENIRTRDHTERLLEYFDYPINVEGNKIIIEGKKKLFAKNVSIPSDISSAAFFIVAALIKENSDILLKNVGLNPLRVGILDVLIDMGANIKIINKSSNGIEPIGDICVKHSKLKPIKLSGEIISRLIDELPILFIACASCPGVSEFFNINELRYKESDRIKSMEIGLSKLGIKTHSTKNSFKVEGGKFRGGIVDSFDDHRIAMSFAIAGLISIKPTIITNTLNINTSFPQFYSTLRGKGIKVYIA